MMQRRCLDGAEAGRYGSMGRRRYCRTGLSGYDAARGTKGGKGATIMTPVKDAKYGARGRAACPGQQVDGE